MNRVKLSKVFVGIAFLSPLGFSADGIPPACRQHESTLALLDCLQNEQAILKQVLEVQELTTRIQKIESERNALLVPPVPVEESVTKDHPENSTNSDSDQLLSSNQVETLERVAWFDHHLEVYAVVGVPESLTALARLDGREYRIKTGDYIRLAQVLNVHLRGIDLDLAGHEFSIGLSSRRPLAANTSKN